MDVTAEASRLISPDSAYVLQIFTILGGLLASMYATYRIIDRLLTDGPVTAKILFIPFSFLIVIGGLFLFMV